MSLDVSSPSLIELGGRGPAAVVLLTLAPLAASGLLASAIPALPAALLWIGGVATALIEWRRRSLRPRAMVLHPPDAVELHWPGHEPVQATLVRHRRVGPLLLLEIDAGHRLRLDCWLPGLPLNASRQLVRQLTRMHPERRDSV
jgi:hypothetical protein